ncbi:hypothetical protein JXJ21_02440 [candidate division KSB1 bacterium]|nr:hypothetical protein [candidate division KSB1 bacterium]
MRKILTTVIIVFFLLSACNREALKIFFDGVDQPVEKPSLNAQESANPSIEDQKALRTKDSTQVTSYQSIHPDYQLRNCNKCHDISKSNALIEQQSELCYHCHERYQDRYPILHGPVAAGFCTACHAPHQSQFKSLLKFPIREICQHCHVPGDVSKNKAHEKISNTSCMECHDSHGGETILMLKKPGASNL